MTGTEYVVKARRLSEQLNSASIKLSETAVNIQEALTPKLDDVGRQIENLAAKAGAIEETGGFSFAVAASEEKALDLAGAALAALMLEVDKHLSQEQLASATKYAVGTQVGEKDLYANQVDYQTAMTKAVAALQPTVSDLAKVSPTESEVLMAIMNVSASGPAVPWKPIVLGGLAVVILWAGIKWRRGRGPAPLPVMKLPRVLRGKIRGVLKFKGA